MTKKRLMVAAMRVARFLVTTICAAVAIWAISERARADCVAPPAPAPAPASPPATGTHIESAIGQTHDDGGKRVVAPVSVNGRGPFRFIVDTGANRSVLSQELAQRLGLTPTSSGEVNSVMGVTVAPFVEVSTVSYHGLALPSAPLPVLQGPMFAGEEGLLGVDGLEGRRLRIDIQHGCVEITASQGAPHLFGWTTVHGQLRFGDLVVMPARIRDVQINVIIDTGSDTSLANVALRDALRSHLTYNQASLDQARAYTAGWPVVLDAAIATPSMQLGEITVEHVFAYVGNFHVFDLWGLTQEPTLLLGMDVISQLRGVAIDYGRSIVQFQLQEQHDPSVRLGVDESRLRGS
jgi:predicted aspartyl protease